MQVKKANKATLARGTERRDRDGSDRARPARDARRSLRHVLSAYKQKKKVPKIAFARPLQFLVRRDAVAQAWRRHVRKEQSMLIALAAARTGSGHLIVELVMPFVAGKSLGDAPFYAY